MNAIATEPLDKFSFKSFGFHQGSLSSLSTCCSSLSVSEVSKDKQVKKKQEENAVCKFFRLKLNNLLVTFQPSIIFHTCKSRFLHL